MRGKLVEHDPTDEPAATVLKRIAIERARLGKSGEIEPSRSDGRRMALDFPVPADGWKAALLHEVLELQTGPFGSSLHQRDYALGGTPVINPASIRSERLVPIDKMAVGKATLERLAAFKLRVNDIVMARRGEMGRCAVVTHREAGWLCGTGSLVLRPSQRVSARFLAMLIGSPRSREYLSSSSVGTTMQNLNQGILLGMPLALSPTKEQQRIVDRVDELMALCDRLEAAEAERETRRDRVIAASLQQTGSPNREGIADLKTAFVVPRVADLATRVVHVEALRETLLELGATGRLTGQEKKDGAADTLFRRLPRTDGQTVSPPAAPKDGSYIVPELPRTWRWTIVDQLASCEPSAITDGRG